MAARTKKNMPDDGWKTTCHVCGRDIPARNSRGKARKYCSERCRSQDNRNKARRWAERQANNDLNLARMRETIDDDERKELGQLDEINRLTDENRKLRRLLRQDANDLAALLDAGVLSIKNSERTAPIMARHMGVWCNMDDWSDREDSLVDSQRKRVLALRKRHREELDRLRAEGRNDMVIEGVMRRQWEERRRLDRECSAYWAWEVAREYEEEMEDEYGLQPVPVAAATRTRR